MSRVETAELIRQLSEISLCQIVDGYGHSLAFESAIKPLAMQFRICGQALTVLCSADDNLTLHHALHIARPGEVLTVSASGSNGAALWGELMSISALAKGLAGTIVDGSARDPLEIATLGYPVFARSLSPRRAAKETYGAVGEPIRCGSLTIHTGDVVVADCHGIVAFPETQLAQVLHQAQAVVQKENALRPKLRTGVSFFELGGFSALVPASKLHRAGELQ